MLRSPYFLALSLGLIVVLNIILFLPTVTLPIRDGDQIGYFSELNGSSSMSDALHLLDYGLSRRFAKGDEVLYRPLSFLWLAVAHKLFYYRAHGWNIANLFFHQINLILLFFLLYTIRRSHFALFFTLLVAILPGSFPLTWNQHLGGYLLGFGFYMAGLIFYYSMRSTMPLSLTVFYSIFTTVSCFFYELIVPFSLAAIPFLFQPQNKKLFLQRLPLLLAPFVTYSLFYVFRDFSSTQRLFYTEEWSLPSFFQGKTITNSFWFAWQKFTDMIAYAFPSRRWQKLVFISIAFGIVYPAILSKDHPVPRKFRVFPLVILKTYVFFLGFMRSSVFRDYYTYLFYLLTIIFIYSVLDFSKLKGSRAFIFLACFFVIFFYHFRQRQKEIAIEIETFKPIAQYFKLIEAFIDKKGGEPNFSFAITNPYKKADEVYELKPGYPDGPDAVEKKRVSEIVFARYYKKTDPLYLLTWDSQNDNFSIKKT